MSWIPYKHWAGNVINQRICVPPEVDWLSAFGPSFNALVLRKGGIGTIIGLLDGGTQKPSYVKFLGNLDLDCAAEVSVGRKDNTDLFWKDFVTDQMDKNSENIVLILRKDLHKMSIQYP